MQVFSLFIFQVTDKRTVGLMLFSSRSRKTHLGAKLRRGAAESYFFLPFFFSCSTYRRTISKTSS